MQNVLGVLVVFGIWFLIFGGICLVFVFVKKECALCEKNTSVFNGVYMQPNGLDDDVFVCQKCRGEAIERGYKMIGLDNVGSVMSDTYGMFH